MKKLCMFLFALACFFASGSVAYAYEADTLEEYIQKSSKLAADFFLAEEKPCDEDCFSLSAADGGDYALKRLIVHFNGKAVCPQEINPVDFVLFENEGVFQFATEAEARRADAVLNARDDVDFSEPDRIVSLDECTPSAVPDGEGLIEPKADGLSLCGSGLDVLSGYETGLANSEKYNWGLKKIRTNHFLPYHASRTAGMDITVGIIDSGADMSHPFLSDSGRVSGVNMFSSALPLTDDNGHGTHVCGILLASTPDNVKLRVYQIFNSEGKSSSLLVSNAMQQAINDGVDVINMSFGGECSYAMDLYTYIAYTNGIVIVAAAGNDAVDASGACPAHNDECVITVGAVTSSNTAADFSNYGSVVDISAPGQSIYSSYRMNYDAGTASYNGYVYMSGTSMATPFVAGMAAMLLSIDGSLTMENILDILEAGRLTPSNWNADPVKTYGSGIACIGACADYIDGVYPRNFSISYKTATATASCTIKIENTTDEAINPVMYMAMYNADDELIGVVARPLLAVAPGKSRSSTQNFSGIDSDAEYIKAYAVDGSMRPVCAPCSTE